MTPSTTVVKASLETLSVFDKRGRKLLFRRPTALDTLRLFKAAGPVLAQNGPWLTMAGLAFSVLEIDGVPVPPPANEPQIESLIDRLGDDGLEAIAELLNEDSDDSDAKEQVGN